MIVVFMNPEFNVPGGPRVPLHVDAWLISPFSCKKSGKFSSISLNSSSVVTKKLQSSMYTFSNNLAIACCAFSVATAIILFMSTMSLCTSSVSDVPSFLSSFSLMFASYT